MGLSPLRPPKPPERGGRRKAKAYEGAFEAVAAVVIGALLGYWADASFDSTPWGLLVGVVLGVAAMVLRLFRRGPEIERAQREDEAAAADGANEER